MTQLVSAVSHTYAYMHCIIYLQRIERQKQLEIAKLAAEQADYKVRNQDFAALTIQGLYRRWKARKTTRQRAYKLLKKHFDTATLGYYYENTVTGTLSWTKPTLLGGYDLDPSPGWVLVPDRVEGGEVGESYYYNPRTMEMQWEQPRQTQLCHSCEKAFCVARLNADHQM